MDIELLVHTENDSHTKESYLQSATTKGVHSRENPRKRKFSVEFELDTSGVASERPSGKKFRDDSESGSDSDTCDTASVFSAQQSARSSVSSSDAADSPSHCQADKRTKSASGASGANGVSSAEDSPALPSVSECASVPSTDDAAAETCHDFEAVNGNSVCTHDACGIHDCESLFQVLRRNRKESLNLSGIRFTDTDLPREDCNLADGTKMRKLVVQQIHNKYVEPLLDITGYKWVRKDVPSKGKGLKVFSVKYTCSQQQIKRRRSSSSSSATGATSGDSTPQLAAEDAAQSSDPAYTTRSRQLSHPLKQFDCESSFAIKYTWSTQSIEISYNHNCHPPFKRLPEKLKPFILERLDMKALDVYQEIIDSPEFQDIRDLIHFSKVQSYWSKERNRKKEESTKAAFKKFLSK